MSDEEYEIRPRLRAPKTAAPGERVTIRSLLMHPMESGRRKDLEGKDIPRRIIYSARFTVGGEEVFAAELSPMNASPLYLEFDLTIEGPTLLEAEWIEDGDERRWTASTRIEIA
ncbi:thiosulfate oxidation carrier complex protein SoxZ [Neomegalonema sp.]|uniref:thiosulfate oxidation carrier complex protein SoxZ n=1 Tax=Neomegalonema sp. TaxID=2039713 RepID=UPI00260258E7|nr:thiosulfate oxidation carrier complex protein SoxZ [Neomegalonema sp.]MDD2868977.1 thiosulfate oxidation carrier complex protein SoxZ [Neomegalonema sp.]